MADPAQGRENLDPDHGGRPDMEGAHRGGGARFDFGARPHCGFFQHMDFERIAWPGKDEEKSPTPKQCWRSGWPTTPVSTAARCGMTATVTGRSGRGVARAHVRP
ncbi:MAG: hypothetical protein ACLRWP_07045 [Bilophila wadsworthia]